MSAYLSLILSSGVLILALATLAGFLGRMGWIFDLFSHFRVQYLILGIGLSLVSLISRQWMLLLLSSVFTSINLAVVLPSYFRRGKLSPAHTTVRLLLINVLRKNDSYHHLLELIQRSQPDIIALIEPNGAWLDRMSQIYAVYPYRCAYPREDNYGIALFSQMPWEGAEILRVGPNGKPTIVASYMRDGEYLTIIVTHPPPPKDRTKSIQRNRQLMELANLARARPGGVVLCGDLNISPWSPYFVDLLKYGELTNSTAGYGIQATWPASNPFLRVPIDHCLVSREVTVLQRSIGPRIGSDHLPVFLDFSY